MNILLTGASGLVGATFARAAARAGHRVLGIVGTFVAPVPGLAESARVDLADESQTRAFLRRARADVIVNCAAIAAPTACDIDPVRSEAINVTLPLILAETVVATPTRLVHLSSEQVYDGTRATAYSIDDPPAPINLYGHQKRRSEEAVYSIAGAQATVVRPPLLLGDSLAGTRSTHEALFAAWSAGKTARLFTDEFRQTCTAANLAAVILAICTRADISGVFNWAGAELVARDELARRIREHFGLSAADAPIIPIARAEEPAAARIRPARLGLDVTPLATRLSLRPQSLAQQLAELHVPGPFHLWHTDRTRSH